MIRYRFVLRAACCALTVLFQPTVMRGAEDPLRALSILGAADGQVKLLAETSEVAADIIVESLAATETKGTFRVSPLRDSAGHLFPMNAQALGTLAAGATTSQAPPTPSGAGPTGVAMNPAAASPANIGTAQVPLTLPAMGAASVHLSATLPAEGDYTGELVIVAGTTPVRVKLLVSRASRNLDVEVLGVEPARATASVVNPSSAALNLVLTEKTGRSLTLDPPALIKFGRKASDGARFQVTPALDVGGSAPAKVALAPNGSTPLAFTFGNLGGAGEYSGTLRFSAPGSKPVDQDFTLNLREGKWLAFLTIALGVIISAALKMIGQNLRPRLVHTRHAQLLVHEIDELLTDPGREPAERAVLRSLRRSVSAVLLDLDGGTLQGIAERLDGLDKRRALAVVWLVRRREVAALRPEPLRDQFRTVIDDAQALILDDGVPTAAVAEMDARLRALPARMNEALRAELVARIAALRDSLKALAIRSTGTLAVTAPGQVTPILDEAEGALQTNDLRGALNAYDRARSVWASLLVDDLAAVVAGPRPFELTGADWDALKISLTAEVAEARRLLADDPDAAIARYNRGWALYVVKVNGAVTQAIARIRAAAKAEEDLKEAERAEVGALLTAAETANAAARSAAVAGRTQEAVEQLETAIAKAREAQSAATPVQNEAVRSFTAPPLVALSLPPALREISADDLTVTEHDLEVTTSRIRRLDFLVAAVAIVIAGLLGVRALWLPNLTWGGWDDHVIALLWGLGLHQFAFAGLSGLTDRLVGNTQQ